MDEQRERRAFGLLNLGVTPFWLAMIIAPRSRLTARMMAWSDVALAGYSAAYAAQIVGAIRSGPPGDPSDVRSLRQAMAEPRGFLVGWTHFLTFDLFVGRWIWRTALEEGRSCRVALLLTLMLGPAGLGLFQLQRRLTR